MDEIGVQYFFISDSSGGQKASQSLRPNNVWCSRLHLYRFVFFTCDFPVPNRSLPDHLNERLTTARKSFNNHIHHLLSATKGHKKAADISYRRLRCLLLSCRHLRLDYVINYTSIVI